MAPTKANFFGRITKDQITDAVIEAECTSAALDAAKMKKGNAGRWLRVPNKLKRRLEAQKKAGRVPC